MVCILLFRRLIMNGARLNCIDERDGLYIMQKYAILFTIVTIHYTILFNIYYTVEFAGATIAGNASVCLCLTALPKDLAPHLYIICAFSL